MARATRVRKPVAREIESSLILFLLILRSQRQKGIHRPFSYGNFHVIYIFDEKKTEFSLIIMA